MGDFCNWRGIAKTNITRCPSTPSRFYLRCLLYYVYFTYFITFFSSSSPKSVIKEASRVAAEEAKKSLNYEPTEHTFKVSYGRLAHLKAKVSQARVYQGLVTVFHGCFFFTVSSGFYH